MSLGADLAAARLKSGLTLQDVADATRIRRTVIERIEADDFSLCGGDVYSRGHVRTIARVVGADSNALVSEFDRIHAPSAPTAAEVFESETNAAPERRAPSWVAAMAAAVIAVIGLVGFQVIKGGSDAPVAGGQASQPVTTSASSPGPSLSQSPTPSNSPSAPPSSSPTTPPIVAVTGVTVILRVIDHVSWVSVKGARGNSLFEGLLQPGASKTFTDKTRVSLIIGRAGSVRLNVNGKDLGSPGSGAQVARLSFGPGNPTSG